MSTEVWAGHRTAVSEEIQKIMTPPEATMDALRADFAPVMVGPRPDLNGIRLRFPNKPEIYLVVDGTRRHIPDPPTYNNLFRGWDGVVVDIDTNDVSEGAPLSQGAVLIRGDGTAAVYLVTNHQKRWITSPAAMDKYYFDWKKVKVLPRTVVDAIPDGATIG